MSADNIDPELVLLRRENHSDAFHILGRANFALQTAPIITGDAIDVVGSAIFPQRALYGSILETSTGAQVKPLKKLYINTNAPFSGIVCGVQGSGKSHSTSVLLEGCLIPDERLGTLPEPLSALLFHFDTSARDLPPCEAAHIASLEPTPGGNATPPKVVVLVFPKNLTRMRDIYSKLPEVKVEPLYFAPEDLSSERMLAMMKVDQDQHMPLYMEYIMSMLRDMEPFSYKEFRRRLKEEKFVGLQKAMLDLRLTILDSCLEGGNTFNCVSNHFKRGQLTIIDLSSPFMDAASACGFFDIILQLFIQARTTASGKLIVLDEAHKYLTNNGASSRLTDSLLGVIRQQRHLGTRVLISTQEPTVVPSKFLDLCSFVIAHRFSSQKWLDHLKEHISVEDSRWGSKVVNLEIGEAVIFSPAALVVRQVPNALGQDASLAVTKLGQGYLIVQSRKRITVDGGRSVMATEPSLHTDGMPKSNAGSIFSSPKSVVESVEALSLSWQCQSDIGQERPRMFGFPDAMSPSLHMDRKLFGSASPNLITGAEGGSTPAAKPATLTNATESMRNVEVQKPQTITPGSSTSPDPVPNVAKAAPTATPDIKFLPLISVLKRRAERGQYQMYFSDLESKLTKLRGAYGELEGYVREAERANLVETGVFKGVHYVQLVDTGSQWCPCSEYVPLVKAMRAFLDIGVERPACSAVAKMIYETHPGFIQGKFQKYVLGATAAGVVVRRKKDRIQLASH